MLRLLRVDLIATCLALTSSWFAPLPVLPTPAGMSAGSYASSVRMDVVQRYHLDNRGIASWYGAVLDGHPTASGEIFDKDEMTACHRTLPFGTMVKVTDLRNHKSVVVRINDRGVLFADRVIDLSSGAARELGMLRDGVAPVSLEVLGRVKRVRKVAAAS